jgi:hypothetical protein
MFKINLFLASLVCAVADIMLDLADALSAAGKFLYRPLPRNEAERTLRRADPEKLAQALKTIRSALGGNMLAPRFPFEDRNPAEVASYSDEILLDLYIGEVAGMLDPMRSILARFKSGKAIGEASAAQVIWARRQQEQWSSAAVGISNETEVSHV